MATKFKEPEDWTTVIQPTTNLFNLNLLEIYKYRELIYMLVKRDFVTFYKQTVLGPLWYVIQPLVNTIVFTIIFGSLANIPTDETPPFLFYMAGTIIWSYFAVCINGTSNVFVLNSHIFGKIYFPRITVPISNVIIALLQFFIQFVIFTVFLVYFVTQGLEISISYSILLIPLLVLQTGVLALGFGMLFSSLTTKYRDLTFALTFGIQLWMYATPVVYPLSIIPEEYRFFAALNPMVSIVECFRGVIFGTTAIESIHILISICVTVLVFVSGLIMFNRVEKSFMDTV